MNSLGNRRLSPALAGREGWLGTVLAGMGGGRVGTVKGVEEEVEEDPQLGSESNPEQENRVWGWGSEELEGKMGAAAGGALVGGAKSDSSKVTHC